jgi:alcohol dehydrogenase class IV
MVNRFNIASTPNIQFGSGKLKLLPKLLETFGPSVALMTGKQSLMQSDHWDGLLLQFESAKIHWQHHIVDKEPTPEMIDSIVANLHRNNVDAVVAIGGGSVMDAGKAVSAMLTMHGSVRDYLEGVGTRLVSGKKIPFIAVPTTSGTGSEATKNAVISKIGSSGFKKSLRHDNYVPDLAVVDAELTLNCPRYVTAQSGMDAFTQLLESYLSTNANPMTDALAVDGIRKIRDSLEVVIRDGDNLMAREQMAYASLLSGITLANAGLGTVHGFASSIGAYFDIPHGLICARMMAPVNRLTINRLKKDASDNLALNKYARIGKLFSKDKNKKDVHYVEILLEVIQRWTEQFDLKRFGDYGMLENDIERIVCATGNKYNPAPLSKDELSEAIAMAM